MLACRPFVAGLLLAACATAASGAGTSATAGAAPSGRERIAERLHSQAVASFRQGRFAEAYGRFMALADAGHPPAAEIVRWMYENGLTLFGRDWDCSPDQWQAWVRLAPPGAGPSAPGAARPGRAALRRVRLGARRGRPYSPPRGRDLL